MRSSIPCYIEYYLMVSLNRYLIPLPDRVRTSSTLEKIISAGGDVKTFVDKDLPVPART